MTEQKQTTSERIATMINEGIDCSCDGGWTNESLVGMLAVAQTIAAEIDALTAQRDEARAMLATIRPAWIDDDVRPETLVETCQRQAAEVDALTRERDEARAEVERLRLPAEAWESLEAWIQACSGPPLPPPEEVRAAYRAHVAAADRARAAKERKP